MMEYQSIEEYLAAYYHARNALVAPQQELQRCEQNLMAALEHYGEKRVHSDELHLTATVATRRTLKVTNEKQLANALNEIGSCIPYKTSIDTSKLRDLSDALGSDFPGIEITETSYLTARGTND